MVKFLIKGESSWVPSRVHCSNKKKSIGIISWPSIFILLKYFTDFPKKSMHKVVRRGREIYTIICKHTFLVFLWSKEEFSLGCLSLWQQCKTISGTQFQIYLCLEPHLIYFKVYFSKMPKVKTLFTMHTVHCIYFSQQRWGDGQAIHSCESKKIYLLIYLFTAFSHFERVAWTIGCELSHTCGEMENQYFVTVLSLIEQHLHVYGEEGVRFCRYWSPSHYRPCPVITNQVFVSTKHLFELL